ASSSRVRGVRALRQAAYSARLLGSASNCIASHAGPLDMGASCEFLSLTSTVNSDTGIGRRQAGGPMRHFTWGPPLTISGRKNKGLRGYAGKPFHPPLTDVPVTAYDDNAYSPVGIVILSAVAALLVSVGATYGGSLVYDYGFNVETAGDHPVWHKNETDVYPGQTK